MESPYLSICPKLIYTRLDFLIVLQKYIHQILDCLKFWPLIVDTNFTDFDFASSYEMQKHDAFFCLQL